MLRFACFVVAVTWVLLPPAAAAGGVAPFALGWEGAHVKGVRVPAGAEVRPVAATPGRTVQEWARRAGALAAINGGFFNHSDGAPVSHVTAEGRALTAPERNGALMHNSALRSLLPRILNRRSEWRAVDVAGTLRWRIAPHDAPIGPTERLRHALQAGPALLPSPALAQEGFVVIDADGAVVRDGIASLSRASRSALGLTARGELLMVTAGGRGLTIAQLAGLMKHLEAVEALALDGGGSSTLCWREGARLRTYVASGGAPSRVNSTLLVMP